jgi:hypothetical protein
MVERRPHLHQKITYFLAKAFGMPNARLEPSGLPHHRSFKFGSNFIKKRNT